MARISSYQKNHAYPIILLAVVSQDDALANWTDEFQIRVLGVAIILVCIIDALGWRLARELRRREQMEAEWARATREGVLLSLLLIDVDQFKAYNDLYGHQQVDECLRKVTAVIAKAAAGEFVACYGSEEIVTTLPNREAASTARIAENICAQVEALGLRHEANPPSYTLTISIGSRKPAFESPCMGATDLILLADKALYRAKQRDRNQVVDAKAA